MTPALRRKRLRLFVVVDCYGPLPEAVVGNGGQPTVGVEMGDQSLAGLAEEAFVYGSPLVVNLEQVNRYVTTGVGSVPAVSFNAFGHARTLATSADTFVSINNDTVYSMAELDLSVGPIELPVPATHGRYYVLQFVDAWTNNFAYVGTRGTGDEAGRFLLVPPGENVSADIPVIHVPTRVASIVGRWAVSGQSDLDAVHSLQDATLLSPTDAAARAPLGIPAAGDGLPEELRFFERLRVWANAFPPAAHDREYFQRFAPLGLTGDRSLAAAAPDVATALSTGYAAGRARIEAATRSGGSTALTNGWLVSVHAIDYNVDYLELGTIDTPEWKITDPATRYLQRAIVAYGGLWGNHGYEATYAITYSDSDGEQLTGDHVYRLRLSPLPPVAEFWSLTMYDLPNYYLPDNPIDRYSLGDRTPGIVYDEDGGITITMSHAEPTEPRTRANWLPAPTGPFRPALRMYRPGAAILDGDWKPPAIERI